MHRFAALLRGIAERQNMTNDKLRAVFEGGLGLEDVGSVLASGNVVFEVTSQTHRPREAHRGCARRDLGISSSTLAHLLRTARVGGQQPFPGVTHSSNTYLTATFIKDLRGVPDVPPGPAASGGTEIVRYDAGARAVLAITDNSEPNTAGGFLVWLERSYGKNITRAQLAHGPTDRSEV